MMKDGSEVYYQNKRTFIETIKGEHALIKNPEWEEGDDGFIRFWIWVKLEHIHQAELYNDCN